MVKTVKFREKHYNNEVRVIVCPFREINPHLQKTYGVDLKLEPAYGYHFKLSRDGETVYFIWLPKMIKQTIPILIHEITHCTNSILDHVGFEFSKQSEEMYAYMNQHLAYRILDKFNLVG